MIHERMLTEHQRLQKELQTIQTKIDELPEGSIFCSKNNRYYKWFQTDGHTQIYITKENRQLAEQLALKKYYQCLAADIQSEQRAIGLYLRHHRNDLGRAEKLLAKPSYQELLSSYFQPLSQELSEWVHSPYDKNPNYPEQRILKTVSGNPVRSKSESLIDMALYNHRIPFRYECALQLNGSTIYPDFTIRHPETGEIFYWEHFGQMDDPNYYKNVCPKLQLYISHNIIPTINLITTYETKNHPLSSETIEKIIIDTFL